MEFSRVKTIVEGAFKPHRCVAEQWDSDCLRFWITTGDGKRFTVGDPNLAPTEKIGAGDTKTIREVIEGVRGLLREKGYPLEEWAWPEE